MKNFIVYRSSAGSGKTYTLAVNYISLAIGSVLFKKDYYKKFKNTEHVHFFCMYIGNYPDLSQKDIRYICKIINNSVFCK